MKKDEETKGYSGIPFETVKKAKKAKVVITDKDEVKHRRLLQTLGAIIIILIIIAGILFACIKYVDFDNLFKTTVVNKSEKEVTVTDSGIADAVEKLYDATVIIEVGSNSSDIEGYGSGVVYKTDDDYGYILTNAHVVDGEKYILIEFTDESTVEGELVGSDTYSDVAVIKVPVKNILAVAEIGSSEDCELGDTIFTIGTPVSLSYSFTVTRGILSGKNRLVSMSSSSSSSSNSNSYYGYGFGQQTQSTTDVWYLSLLQIDATINSGNSGGPLANANGEVIGLTNSKLSSYSSSGASIENMGFAIPIEDAIAVATKLEKDGKVTRPVLGVTMTTVAGAAQNGIDIDDDITSGAVVVEVSKGSNADSAGLEKGDVITKIDDYEVTNYLYLKYYLYRYSIGDKITITYIRDGKTKTTEVTLKD